MNSLTAIDEYLDALLDGSALERPALDTLEFDRLPRDPRHAGVDLRPGTPGTTAAEVRIGQACDEGLAATAPDALAPSSHLPRPAPMPAAPPPTPAFVPAFVPESSPAAPAPVREIAATPPVHHDPSRFASDPTHHPATPAPMTPPPRWLRVAVRSDSYAVELLCVQEVVRLAPIVALRGAARAVLGVMNLRGRVLPVIDLGLWLHAGSVPADDRSRIVVVERNDEMIGVLVSAVEDVVTLGRDRIEPPLPSSAAGAIVGIARVGAAPTVLLDANALFA